MFKTTWEICKVFGIPIKLDISLLILFMIMQSNFSSPIYGLVGFAFLLLSIVLHELGHSLTAKAFGCRIIDIKLMLIGGAARLASLPRKAWQELLVAIAGPAVSLVLGVGALYLARPEMRYAIAYGQYVPYFSSAFQEITYYSFGWGNLILFCFNLLPAFPMDGGRVLRSFLQQFFTTRLRATWIASRVGRAMAIFFAACAVLNLFGVNVPFFGGTLNLLLIAYFIYISADREYRMVLAEETVYGGESPFARFFGSNPFFRKKTAYPPPGDGKAVVSPPPYGGTTSRVDVKKS